MLDDTGKTNAGLHALRLVRFDIIKIDGDVISRLGNDPSAVATVAAALTFVQQAGGWIIAEGIEEPGMLTKLLQPGLGAAVRQPVIAGQGYLLGRPNERPVGLDTRPRGPKRRPVDSLEPLRRAGVTRARSDSLAPAGTCSARCRSANPGKW
jgi:EAL domain-containing protein (putative c-di-GMP-specific phosphodiesterase class I)